MLTGTNSADTWLVHSTGSDIQIYLNKSALSGLPDIAVPGALDGLTFNAGYGDDVLTIDSTLPIVPVFSGAAGNNRIQIHGGVNVFSQDLITGNSSLALTIDGDTTIVAFNASQHLNALSIGDHARVNLGAPLLRTRALTLGADATLDLRDNDLVVQSDQTNRTTALGQVRDAIAAGRTGGMWVGPGIIASTAAGAGPSITGLGVILNDDGAGRAIRSTFDGESADTACILVKYTYNGDVDLNGKIDADDYFRLDQGFLTGATAYRDGDLDYDQRLTADDFMLIDMAFLRQGAVMGAAPVMEAIKIEDVIEGLE